MKPMGIHKGRFGIMKRADDEPEYPKKRLLGRDEAVHECQWFIGKPPPQTPAALPHESLSRNK